MLLHAQREYNEGGHRMTNYREILRLSSLGLNKTQIAQSVGCSRTTVIQVLNIAEEKASAKRFCCASVYVSP